MNQKNKLIIFVKNEEAGKVKTRLAASVGDEKALSVYQKLLTLTARVTRTVGAQKEVWYSRFIPEQDVWSPEAFSKKVQKGQDLGERMSYAFRSSFEEGIQKAIIIGSDCAELKTSIIEEAFKALDDVEFVIGPAKDGGYYLLGMRNFHPEIFKEMEWSTESVLQKTLEEIAKGGHSVRQLQSLNDVDTVDDWKQVKDLL